MFGKQEGTTKFSGHVYKKSTKSLIRSYRVWKMIGITENQESPAFHSLIGLNRKR